MPIFEVERDLEAEAAYVRVGSGVIVRTEQLDESTLVDYDEFGGVVGVEFLNVGILAE